MSSLTHGDGGRACGGEAVGGAEDSDAELRRLEIVRVADGRRHRHQDVRRVGDGGGEPVGHRRDELVVDSHVVLCAAVDNLDRPVVEGHASEEMPRRQLLRARKLDKLQQRVSLDLAAVARLLRRRRMPKNAEE